MQRSRPIDRYFNNPLPVLATSSKRRVAACVDLLSRFRAQRFRQSLRELVGGLFAWSGLHPLSYQNSRRGAGQGRLLVSRRRICLEPLEQRALLTWIGATSGVTNDAAHDYNDPNNWAGGVIDDSFNGVNFAAGSTTLYFSADRTTTAAGM